MLALLGDGEVPEGGAAVEMREFHGENWGISPEKWGKTHRKYIGL